jgi:hypothetical protein
MRALDRLVGTWQTADFTVRYEAFEKAQCGDGEPTEGQIFAETASEFVRALALAVVCWWKGHQVECESSVGPDHGAEHFYCSRCGWSDTVVWY